jgi:dienelactone hydrolase
MSDHAAVVPTPAGPAGVVVSEPRGEQRGALVLLHGVGPSSRAGVNGIWAGIAREVAALGLAVLRFDYATEGDSSLAGADVPRERGWMRTDLAMLRQIAQWFLRRIGERRLFVAGSCHGGRLALEFAANDPAADGLFLVVPYLLDREPKLRGASRDEIPPGLDGRLLSGGPTLDTDAELVDGLRACAARGPLWMLVGGGDEERRILPYTRALEESGASFELEVVPGSALHPVGSPAQQSLVRARLLDRVARALAERRAVSSVP